MQDPIFGNENAELDELLSECFVRINSPETQKPILTGRWGTGKSALLLLNNKQMSELLPPEADYSRIWYIDERTLDLNALAELERQFSDDPRFVRRTLEHLWKGELIRTYCNVLSRLADKYVQNSGDHWRFVHRVASAKHAHRTLWSQIPNVIAAITGESARARAVHEVQESVTAVIDDEALLNVLRCLADIRHGEPVPGVAVEPIETPHSMLERQQSLATNMVGSLLNVFQSHFQPTAANRVNLRITLPWHRFQPESLDFPQKLRQYIGNVQWTRAKLREFINRRIEFEYRRVGRRFTEKGVDAWSTLFETGIPNGICRPRIVEDSFDYFLRHTHHRARDLQRLARLSVEAQAEKLACDVDDVLFGSGGRVKADVVRETFHRECPRASDDLIIEASRRYPEMGAIVGRLHGLSIPFDKAELKRRMDEIEIPVVRALDLLWEAGIAGVTAVPLTASAADLVGAFLTRDEAHRRFTADDGTHHERWSWFEYNWDGGITKLLDSLSRLGSISYGLILHSKVLEYFSPQSMDTASPIGI
ncbi:MAG TPA: hypothetical protein VGJ81_10460 [Thermoanaerobaculia bacterium]|jgi:hypothetical protein